MKRVNDLIAALTLAVMTVAIAVALMGTTSCAKSWPQTEEVHRHRGRV